MHRKKIKDFDAQAYLKMYVHDMTTLNTIIFEQTRKIQERKNNKSSCMLALVPVSELCSCNSMLENPHKISELL
jgi:hypothetical protein